MVATGRFSKIFSLLRIRVRYILGGSYREYGIVFFVYTLLAFVFTDYIVFNITHQLFINGPGDGTSGFLWMNYADRDWNPDFGNSNLIDYPTGANLGSPTYVTYAALWVPLWLFSKLFGPIAGLNIITLFAFIGSALSSYWLVRRLSGSPLAAFFAGYAIAFVPYNIIKSSAHLAYIFSIVFVLILAAFIAFWRKPSIKRAILLASTIGLAYYTDGYYLLIATVFVVTLFLGSVLYRFLIERAGLREIIKPLIIPFAALLATLALISVPIVATKIIYNGRINQALSLARDNINDEVNYYAASPLYYIVPPDQNPILSSIDGYRKLQQQKNSKSNPSENTLYFGYVVLILGVFGVVTAARGSKKLSHLKYLATVTLLSTFIMYIFSLPPGLRVLGTSVNVMPTALMLSMHVDFWRVYARFFIPMHVIVVVFSSAYLSLLFEQLSRQKIMHGLGYKRTAYLTTVILITILTVETMTLVNRPAFDFNRLAPAYTWLKKQDDIRVVAEFPLVTRPWDYAVSAVTAQMVHGKSLINSQLPQQAPNRRNSLGEIDNPEAVDYAVHRGAQMGITHGRDCTLTYPWLTMAYDGFKDLHGDKVCMYRLRAASGDTLYAAPNTGFTDVPLFNNREVYNMLYGNYAELIIRDYLDQNINAESGHAAIQFELGATPGKQFFNGRWSVLQDEKVIANGIFGAQHTTVHAVIDPSKIVQIRTTKNDGTDPEPGRLSLHRILVSTTE